MYIYLKKDEALTNSVKEYTSRSFQFYLEGIPVYEYESTPHIQITEDFDVLKQRQNLSKLFLKATIVTFPRYGTRSREHEREFGIYYFGKAKAELTPGENCPYCLRVEASSWESIADMKTLQEKLWAGTIVPSVVYDRKQKKQHPLNILAQILNSRKLTWLQRFILAFRLARPKPSC